MDTADETCLTGRQARRRALCVGLSRFTSPSRVIDSATIDEPGINTKDALPFAVERVSAMTAALQQLGYECTVSDETRLHTADQLGHAVRIAITSVGDGDIQIVHVLSHGESAKSSMHIVGADGDWTPATNVASWIAEIEDYPDKPRPHTLFLIDTCHAGDAARLSWLPAAEPGTRAWVIAATEPGRLAYDGRFTQAVATILTRIASGDIDLYPGEYVPFGDVVELIRREVARLGASHQYVTSTPVDGRPAPPFFINPRQPTDAHLARAKEDTDTAVVPFLDLDVALDAAHFLDRATGHRFGADLDTGCFTGREQELAALAAWIDGDEPGSLRVITGGAGSGKSALLGILVCAAHPGLRAATERLWSTADARVPRENGQLAAIHLRERDLGQTLAALIRQLHLPLRETETNPSAVVDAITRRADPAVIVVDALDEANGQDAIMAKLLVPLACERRDGQTPACRLVVGMRPWKQFRPLRNLAEGQDGLVDLDRISSERLRVELQDYVNDILSLVSYPLPSRRALKGAVAAALTASDRQRGGEFLAAALYSNWLIGQYPHGVTQGQAADLARKVPRTFPELLDLDLESHADDPWPLAVLMTTAYAHGAGMPASVIMRLAPVFRSDGNTAELTPAEFNRVLAQIRFYLRSSPDTDGTTLYRLFHQGLADHLRTTTANLSALLDRLLTTAPVDNEGQRRWDAAEPYVRRHGIQHAVDAGRLGELVRLDPDVVEQALNTAATPEGRLSAIAYQQSVDEYRNSDPLGRRDLLAINATRHGAQALVDKLGNVPGLPAAHYWRPLWATGGQLHTPYIAIMRGHTGAVAAVACTTLEGRPVAVTGSLDGTLRIWDLVHGRLRGRQQPGPTAPVHAITCATLHGNPVAITGSENGMVQVWELESGQPQCDPMPGHTGPIAAITYATIDGHDLAISAGDDGVRVWNLETGDSRMLFDEQLTEESPQVHEDSLRPGTRANYLLAYTVHALTCITLPGGPAVVTAGEYRKVPRESRDPSRVSRRDETGDGPGVSTIQVWDLATAQLCAPTMPQDEGSAVTAIACTILDGRPITVTAQSDGTIQVRDLETGRPLTQRLRGHTNTVHAIACTRLGGRAVAVSGARDGTLRIWDLAAGKTGGDPLTGHFRTVDAVACSTLDGRPIAVTGGNDGAVRVWDVAADHARGRPPAIHTSVVFSVACGLVGDCPVAVTCGYDTSVRVWDLNVGRVRDKALIGHSHWVRAVACTTLDGHAVTVTGGADGTVRIWDLATGEARGEPLKGHFSTVFALACTMLEGQPVAISGGFDKAVRVWDLCTGQLRGKPLTGHDSWVKEAACTTLDGRPIAVTAGFDATLRIWDLTAGRAYGEPLTGHTSEVTTVDCTVLEDQPVAVSGGMDGTVRVWDLATGQARGAPLTGHIGKIWTVACTVLDGHPVAVSSGEDRSLRTWDLTEHREMAVTTLPDKSYALAVTPGGDLVVTFGWELCMFSRYW